MKQTIQTRRLWFLAHGDEIFPRFARQTRAMVILGAETHWGVPWATLKAQGYHIVKAAVSWIVKSA